tara:strand:- start:30 stop:743 length:714 start_codon:yes stop_codon:yes gene_type:complete
MEMVYEFRCPDPSWVHNFDNEIQVTIVEGQIGDKITREKLEDNVDGDNLVYDSQSNKIFKRPNKLICIQGSIEMNNFWSDEGIEATDVDRLKELTADDKIKAGVYSESTTADAISNKEFKSTYQFNCDYDVLAPMSREWALATPGTLKATSTDTRLFCMLTERSDYQIKILDILPGDLKSINRDQSKTLSYVFFSQKCSIRNGAGVCDQYSVKKLQSDTIDIRNLGDLTARIILIER